MNIRIGKISRWFTPNLSQCERCKTTWAFVEPRTVDYEQGRGCFALCKKCWNDTTIDTRIELFCVVWQRYWYKDTAWALVKNAVAKASQ